MAVKIITDSSADLEKEILEKYNIEQVPLIIRFPDESEYFDGVAITKKEFYEKMYSFNELPKTTQVNQARFEEVFAKYPNDEIIVITISSKMSGTYNSACAAKEALKNQKITVVDSENVTFGLGAIVTEAAKMANTGAKTDEIIEKIKYLIPRTCLLAVIGDLKYLRLGGRLTGASAFIGAMLNVKPIISIVDGEVKNIAKIIGFKKAVAYIRSLMDKDRDESYPLYYGHTDDEEGLKNFYESLGLTDVENVKSFIGCTVGTHVGRGSSGVVYFKK